MVYFHGHRIHPAVLSPSNNYYEFLSVEEICRKGVHFFDWDNKKGLQRCGEWSHLLMPNSPFFSGETIWFLNECLESVTD